MVWLTDDFSSSAQIAAPSGGALRERAATPTLVGSRAAVGHSLPASSGRASHPADANQQPRAAVNNLNSLQSPSAADGLQAHADVELSVQWDRGVTSGKGGMAGGGGAERVMALYAYEARQEDELSFTKGALITVLSRKGGDWWSGRLEGEGRVGLFPANYVTAVGSWAPTLGPQVGRQGSPVPQGSPRWHPVVDGRGSDRANA